MPTTPETNMWGFLLQGGSFALLTVIVIFAGKSGLRLLEKTAERFIISLDKLDVSVAALGNVVSGQDTNSERRYGDLRVFIEQALKETRHTLYQEYEKVVLQSDVDKRAFESEIRDDVARSLDKLKTDIMIYLDKRITINGK